MQHNIVCCDMFMKYTESSKIHVTKQTATWQFVHEVNREQQIIRRGRIGHLCNKERQGERVCNEINH